MRTQRTWKIIVLVSTRMTIETAPMYVFSCGSNRNLYCDALVSKNGCDRSQCTCRNDSGSDDESRREVKTVLNARALKSNLEAQNWCEGE